jgi:hypothetical protein
MKITPVFQISLLLQPTYKTPVVLQLFVLLALTTTGKNAPAN